jgi:hypothetical protein
VARQGKINSCVAPGRREEQHAFVLQIATDERFHELYGGIGYTDELLHHLRAPLLLKFDDR